MDQIERIAHMEQIMRRAEAAVQELDRALEAFLAQQEPLRELEDYYKSALWLADYDSDSAGLLPPELPRGVLSEDGIYDLLAERDRLLARIRAEE